MIEIDRRDDRDRRTLDDIGRIIASAHADFEDQGIRLGVREGEEGDAGRDLKEGDGLARIDTLAFVEQRGEIGLVDLHRMGMGGETDALVEAHEMRRCIGVYAIACRFEDRAQIGADRPLAVGACNMEGGRQGFLRIAETFEQALDAIQRQIDELRVKLRQSFKNDVAAIRSGLGAGQLGISLPWPERWPFSPLAQAWACASGCEWCGPAFPSSRADA